MAKHGFTIGERFLLRDEHVEASYEITRVAPDTVYAMSVTFRQEHVFSVAALRQALAENRLRFAVTGRHSRQPGKHEDFSTHSEDPNLAFDQPVYRFVARFRQEVIKPLIDVPGRTGAMVAARLAEVGKVRENFLASLLPEERVELERWKTAAEKRRRCLSRRPSEPLRELFTMRRSQLWQWLRAYEHARDIRALTSRYKRAGHTEHLHEELVEIIGDRLYAEWLKRPHNSFADIAISVSDVILSRNKARRDQDRIPLPSLQTLQQQIRRESKKLPEWRVIKAQQGEQAYREYLRERGGELQVERILDRVELDHVLLPFMVIDHEDRLVIGRPLLTFGIDVFSHMPWGYFLSFEPESYYPLAQCLHHGILPKTGLRDRFRLLEHDWEVEGVPSSIAVDGGSEFMGHDLKVACEDLGIDISHLPPYTGWFKGTVERFFRTLNQRLLGNQSGTTFTNIYKRRDYDPAANACVTLADLHEMLNIFFVDIYPHKFNRRFVARPIELWREGVQETPVPYPDNADDLHALLGRTEQRTVTMHGIEFLGIHYNSPALLPFRGDRVKVKYDPGDLSEVVVFDSRLPEPLHVRSTHRSYTNGLTLWKHRVIREFARDEENKDDIEALVRAKRNIQSIVERAWNRTKRTRARKEMARYKFGGNYESLFFPEDESMPETASDKSADLRTAPECPPGRPELRTDVKRLVSRKSETEVKPRRKTLPPAGRLSEKPQTPSAGKLESSLPDANRPATFDLLTKMVRRRASEPVDLTPARPALSGPYQPHRKPTTKKTDQPRRIPAGFRAGKL